MIKDDLRRYAESLGFDRMGVTSADPLPDQAERLQTWLSQGFEGDMAYMRRAPESRANPRAYVPEAKSVLVMASRYGKDAPVCSPSHSKAKIARYAQGADYHTVLRKRLDSFTRYLDAMAPGHQHRTFVDTGPFLERAFAQKAGIGFVGKNTLLIGKGLGSFFFLASVVTTLELPVDAPDLRTCGTCRLCLEACPTQAFTGPFELDARRCISYLTIESDGPIDLALRGSMGDWVFGCDVCQEVCPHNARQKDRAPAVDLKSVLSLGTSEFASRFKGKPILRAGREGFLRSACVAAGNSGDAGFIPDLKRLAHDPSPIVREHAQWAIEKLLVGL